MDANQPRLGRRQIMGRLGALGVAAGAGTLAVPALAGVAEAQQSNTSSPSPTTASTAPTTSTTLAPQAPQPTDLAFLAFAQSLEVAVVQLYTTALATNRLGVDAAGVGASFQSDHRQHGQSFAGLGGRVTAGVPNQSLIAAYTPRVQSAASEADLLAVLLELETALASTYTDALNRIIGTNPAGLIGSILPIEARHAVVFGQTLNLPVTGYVPAFESTTGALTVARFPILES